MATVTKLRGGDFRIRANESELLIFQSGIGLQIEETKDVDPKQFPAHSRDSVIAAIRLRTGMLTTLFEQLGTFATEDGKDGEQ